MKYKEIEVLNEQTGKIMKCICAGYDRFLSDCHEFVLPRLSLIHIYSGWVKHTVWGNSLFSIKHGPGTGRGCWEKRNSSA